MSLRGETVSFLAKAFAFILNSFLESISLLITSDNLIIWQNLISCPRKNDKDKNMAMTKEHREVLQGNHVMFVENLILSEELMAVLMADGTLTTSLLETVQAQKTRSDRVRELMFTLTRRGDRAYTDFLQGLVESRQDHLATCLDRVAAERFIEKRDQEVSEKPRPRAADVEVQPSFDISWQPTDSSVDEMDTVWYDKLFRTDTKELGVELKQIPPERQKLIMEMMKSKKAYPLIKKNDGYFGRAVIINNMHYYNFAPRPGSDMDCERLKKLFEQLHFEPDVHEDLTAKEMEKILLDERDNQKHHEYSYFVLCILAHGHENKVYGIDGDVDKGAIDIPKITSWFSSVNCPGLSGKPKLFFIQACQGGKDMIAAPGNRATVLASSSTDHNVQSDGGSHAKVVRVNHSNVQSDAQPETSSQKQISGDSSSRPLQTPEVADVLVAYSTAPGYKSWRHAEFGTWFIRCLSYVILNNACEDHVLDMLTQVAFIISHFKVKQKGIYAVQVPQIVSTLRKKVYFMP